MLLSTTDEIQGQFLCRLQATCYNAGVFFFCLENLLSIFGQFFFMPLNHWSVWKHITFTNKAVSAKK